MQHTGLACASRTEDTDRFVWMTHRNPLRSCIAHIQDTVFVCILVEERVSGDARNHDWVTVIVPQRRNLRVQTTAEPTRISLDAGGSIRDAAAVSNRDLRILLVALRLHVLLHRTEQPFDEVVCGARPHSAEHADVARASLASIPTCVVAMAGAPRLGGPVLERR